MENRELYKRFWPYVKRYLRWTIFALGATVAVSSTSGLLAWLIKPVLDSIFVNKDSTLLYLLPLGVLAVFVLKAVFIYMQSYLVQLASLSIVRDLRDDLFGVITYLPVIEFNKTTTGNLISRVINDIAVVNRMGAGALKSFVQQSFTIVSLLVVVFIRNWQLALISMIIFPFVGYFVSKYGKKVKGITRKVQAQRASLTDVLQETITGSRIVKTFNMEEAECGRFMAENERLTSHLVRTAKVSNRVSPVMEAVGGATVAIIILYGGSSVINGSMTAGDFFSFTAALLMMYSPVKALGNIHNDAQQALAAAERVFELMDAATEKEKMDAGTAIAEGVADCIRYEDLSFRYASDEDYVLKDVNLTVKKGEVVALVGSSGSGKTTLVNLLPRFYEPESGSITIDGTDLREFGLRSLRQMIALVTQDTILFNDTITNNIGYGKKGCTPEQVRAAAAAAHADGFIDKLPRGYDTVIGEKGVRLSGGEKQRLSIARALLKNSPVLILDEATSALDTESERIVQKALENLMKNRTTLVIAHRLSTIINADKIAVVHDGRIIDTGRHSELLEKSTIYRKLYEMQFGGMKEAHVEAR